MGDIYRGAYVTVAASLAKADDEGFLVSARERQVYAGKKLEFSYQSRLINDIRVRNVHDFRQLPFHSVKEALSTRGWTMQERLLSARLLSYSSGVIFECATSTFCECGHGLYPDPIYPSLDMIRGLDNKNRFLALINNQDRNNIAEMYSLWIDVVTVYSGRKLTFETDRQIAISAVTRALAIRFDDENIAGLWKGNFITGLSWYCDNRIPRVKSPTTVDGKPIFLGPSWSWHSADRLVFTTEILPQSPCKIVRINVQEGAINDKGPAKGYIELKAPVGLMTLHMDEQSQFVSEQSPTPKFELLNPAGVKIERYETALLRLDTIIESCVAVNPNGEKYDSARRVLTAIDPPSNSFSAKISCLYIGLDSNKRNDTHAHVFLLLAGHDNIGGAYTRIGMLILSISEDQLEDWLGGPNLSDVCVY
jgi:hypothetical protein